MADCQISLPLIGLLKVVPRFIEKVSYIMARNELKKVSVNFTSSMKGPIIMDEQSPTTKAIIHDQEVLGSILHVGSRVNVINKNTCDQLEITLL